MYPTMIGLMGASLPSLYYYNKIIGNLNHTTVCLHGLSTMTLTAQHYALYLLTLRAYIFLFPIVLWSVLADVIHQFCFTVD
jgi:hypothetical protein